MRFLRATCRALGRAPTKERAYLGVTLQIEEEIVEHSRGKIVATEITIFSLSPVSSNYGSVNFHRPILASAARPVALYVGCLIIVTMSGILVYGSVVETNAFQELRAAFYAIPVAEGTSRIKPDALGLRLFVLGIEGILMAGVAIFLFRAGPNSSGKNLSANDVVAGSTLFVLCGAALMSYVLGCFLNWPIWRNTCHLHVKEGLIDTFHPVAFAISGIIIGVIAAKKNRAPDSGRFIPCLLMALAVALFFMALEEISWGQVYFGWQTPEQIAEWNYQNETNLHNAFNYMLGQAYLAAGLVSFLAIAAAIAIRQRMPGHPISRILPNAPVFWGAIWLLPASQTGVYTETEPFESILAILILFYAVNLWRTSSLAEPSRLDQHQQNQT